MPSFPNDLLHVIAQIDDPETLAALANDLFTPAEIETLNERWAIVKALAAGASQRDVAESVGVSITTVSRGSRQLKYGAGGFERALELAGRVGGADRAGEGKS